jgi:hypothetical protein
VHVDRLLDAAVITTASVLLVGVTALALFAVTAVLERWIDRPDADALVPLGPAVDPVAPSLFDQDAVQDTRQAS